MELDILIFAAHPDDAELSMGGAIAKLTAEGYKVGLVDLSRGELGTRGTPELRLKEAEEASRILNLTHRENLGFKDGNLKYNEEHLHALIRKIREFRPKILFAPYFNDRHPDHIGVGNLVKEAFFFSGLPKIVTGQDAYRPGRLFYYMQTYEFKPSFIVDISETFETKMNAVRAYKSQFYNPNSDEPETFISQPNFLKFLEARAKVYGFKIGKDYGEPFFCEEEIEFDIVQLIK
jgi:bacillithiol biosynthesis deacetylase BshB1